MSEFVRSSAKPNRHCEEPPAALARDTSSAWEFRDPYSKSAYVPRGMRVSPVKRTAVSLLADEVLDCALVGRGHGLLLDGPAAVVEALGLVHGALQRVALPAEEVVGVGTRAAIRAAEAPHERIGCSSRPQAVELVRLPRDLESDLRHSDGVGFGAGRSVVEVLGVDRVVHVRLVVWAIEVLAVPASRQAS